MGRARSISAPDVIAPRRASTDSRAGARLLVPLLQRGDGVPKDRDGAEDVLLWLGEQGDADADFELARVSADDGAAAKRRKVDKRAYRP